MAIWCYFATLTPEEMFIISGRNDLAGDIKQPLLIATPSTGELAM